MRSQQTAAFFRDTVVGDVGDTAAKEYVTYGMWRLCVVNAIVIVCGWDGCCFGSGYRICNNDPSGRQSYVSGENSIPLSF